MNIDELIVKITTVIINPIITFLFVGASAYFLWGLILFFLFKGDDPAARKTGIEHMKWGIVGMFIMVSVFGIMRIIVNTFEVDLNQYGTSIPSN